MKKALVVVDMQNDFVCGALGTKEAQAIVEPMKAYLQAERNAGVEVIFTRDTHGAEYLTLQEGKNLPVPHCIKNTTGWEIVDGLYQTGERIFDKFYQADSSHKQEGNGLGLALAKSIVDFAGGNISVQNLAIGCRFTVSLPK